MANTVGVEEVIKHLPRAYQEELYHIARRQNVIAALDTGSGKTFIAAMLIKSISASQEADDKKIVFLVPKVPLVDQQCEFLQAQTPLRISGYKGAMNVDSWDKRTWHREFGKADVLVMTAQIFKNVLTHAYWKMEMVSLIIFDECHHAQNQHPYNTIMTDHYVSCPFKDRPKVFGMTASPVWNTRDPEASIQVLQFNLFAQVFSVRERTQELSEHSPKPSEVILHYAKSPSVYGNYPNPSLWVEIAETGILKASGIHDMLQTRYKTTMDALGPAGADYFLSLVLAAKLNDKLKVLIESDFQSADSEEQAGTPTDYPRLKNALDTTRERLSVKNIPSNWLSPKFAAVVELLKSYQSLSFQAIIFVEQRQVATALNWLLSRVLETKDWIRCAELMGHGDVKGAGIEMQGMGLKPQVNVVRAFKRGELNLLVATSVAEEGLDFPACDLVIRFDPVKTMISYVQSRGRARHKTSTFVVMIEKNDEIELQRYQKMKEIEPELKRSYQASGTIDKNVGDTVEHDDELEDPRDVHDREVYVVPATGASLTYSSAIMLLSNLCSFIPRDKYTAPYTPKYSGSFQARLELPNALPLPKELLVIEGPEKRTKREAKRAVAFRAVKMLHELGVFDDYLSPSKAKKGEGVEDADGNLVAKVSDVPEIMDVQVKSPWVLGPPWYMHIVSVDDRCCAGFLSGQPLLSVELLVKGHRIKASERQSAPMLEIDDSRVQLMERFTKMGIWWCVTGSPIESRLAAYLVPLDGCNQPDWFGMEVVVSSEYGVYDWSRISNAHEGKLLIMNSRHYGKSLLLERFRHDLHLDEKSDFLNEEGEFLTYAEYFMKKYPGWGPSAGVHPEGPIIEVSPLQKQDSLLYELFDCTSGVDVTAKSVSTSSPQATFLLPRQFCKWVAFSEEIVSVFQIFAPLCQRITDVYRAQYAKANLGLPDIAVNRMIEALTIPSAAAGFNNQRLETLGDSVLKLSVVTYVFNRFPYKHEGQLDQLKATSISNRCLLARARRKQLECYISSETRAVHGWHFVIDEESSLQVRRKIPRRSLQDCMEAILGAAYLTGGVEMALEAGHSLGLCFGGKEPWATRYGAAKDAPCSVLFNTLQETLGYKFRNGQLLLEALTHPSADLDGVLCYQRLEFLGDAVLDLVIASHLFRTFPTANSGQLSWIRSRVICNATLAAVAVKKFSLHKYLIVNNVELSKAIADEIDYLEVTSYAEIVRSVWKYDPPKTLGDIFESVVGAVFVDTGYDFVLTSRIVKLALDEVLSLLQLDMPRDPVSELLVWAAKAGCRRIRFRKIQSNPQVKKNDSVTVIVHDTIVAGPVVAANLSLAKGTASVEALHTLRSDSSELSLSKLCDCMSVEGDEESRPQENREKDLDNETEEGCTMLAEIRLDEADREKREIVGVGLELDCNDEDEDEDVELSEVEAMLTMSGGS